MGLSKNKSFQLLISLCYLQVFYGQNLELNLESGNSQHFKGSLYCFGIRMEGRQNSFQIYRLNFDLQKKDSLSFDLGRSSADPYLQCYSDTLHGFLNVYVQKKDKNQVSVFRFNPSFEKVAHIEQVDVARLNPISSFNNEVYYSGKSLYSINTQADTSGRQFYLNKYELKSELKNFEYENKWQFPFERKNIQSAHVFYADKQAVLLHVYVESGQKKGQWILKINASNGRLIKGSKLNDKNEEQVYTFGSFFYEPLNKSLLALGQKFNPQQFLVKENKLAVGGASVVLLYLIKYDSIGDPVLRQEFKLPVTEVKSPGKKILRSYFIQFSDFQKTGMDQYLFETDVYQAIDKSLCYTYCNSLTFSLTMVDEKYQLEKKNISANPMVESFLFNNDKLDMNGKMCTDSSNRIEQVFYKEPSFRAKLKYGLDSLSKPVWLLNKSTFKNANISYQVLQPNKTTYELKKLEDIPKSTQPQAVNLDLRRFVIIRQSEETKFLLRLYKW